MVNPQIHTKTLGKLRALFISDIHLGNRRTTTESIIKGLDHLIYDNEENQELDVIFIAGDVFDKGLNFYDDDITLIQRWQFRLLNYAAKFNICIRVLEGTPFHDRKQSISFINTNFLMNNRADIEYIKEVEIRKIDPLGLDVLYIPDEIDPNTDITKEKVKKLLKEKNLEQVDFTIMHGMFEHQLAEFDLNFHDAQYYSGITRFYVSIGHVHKPSVFLNIIAQGSPTRLSFKEEEDKGIYYLDIDLNNRDNDRVVFKVNPFAKRYDTIDALGLTEKGLTSRLHALIEELPDDSYIRIKGYVENDHHEIFKVFKKKYSQFRWEFVRVVKDKEKKEKQRMTKKIPTMEPLNETTIIPVVTNLIDDEDKHLTEIIKQELVEVMR